jgi:septation ring formation regulator EzrA
MDQDLKVMVVDIINKYNENAVKYSIIEKRTADLRNALDLIEVERKELHNELQLIREREQEMVNILKNQPDFDMEQFKIDVQEIAKNIGAEKI